MQTRIEERPGEPHSPGMRAHRIQSVRIDAGCFLDAMEKVRHFLRDERLHMIATVNPEFLMAARKDAEFRRILNHTDLNVADGTGVQLALRLLRGERCERITGVDLTWAMAGFAAAEGRSMFLLGAAPGVASAAADRLREFCPGLRIAGCYAGSPDESGIVDRVNAARPDILLVAFGAPRQEKFIARHAERLCARVAMGVGGTFDFIAGVIPRAPVWMRRCGLEWLYRLAKQPARWKRILNAVLLFPASLAFSEIARSLGSCRFFGRRGP